MLGRGLKKDKRNTILFVVATAPIIFVATIFSQICGEVGKLYERIFDR
jgi:hypothetical protein